MSTALIDPTDRYDFDREWEVTPTGDSYVPLATRYPDTVACDEARPADCPCATCAGWREYAAYEDSRCCCELDWICGRCREAGVMHTPLERINDEWAKLDTDPRDPFS